MASHVHDLSVDYTKIENLFVFVFPSRRRQKSSHVLGTCIVLIGLFSFQIFQLPILKKEFCIFMGGGGGGVRDVVRLLCPCYVCPKTDVLLCFHCEKLG